MKLYRLRYAQWAALFFTLCSPQLSVGGDRAYGRQGPGSIVEGQALATTAKGSSGVLVIGFDTVDVSALKVLSSSSSVAVLEEFRLGEGLFASSRLAKQLSINPGDLVTLLNPIGQNTPMGSTPLVIRYRVLGIVDSPLLSGADSTVYLSRVEAKKFPKPAD
ncbi:hypothetical protein [Agrobacterium sp. NPDC089420]|uniref:hypothetical protein n=1 Tax=Agrobacterium sp. NPDC089420 TaxID=3363918 RepID=UPI00384EA4B8